jgi:hypothetical protein
MTRFTRCLLAAAVVAGFGLAAQSAGAAPPVIVHPTFKPFPTHGHGHNHGIGHGHNHGVFRPLPFPAPRHDHDYIVLHRPSPFGGWQFYGKFETRHGAEMAERRLEWQGIPTRVIRACDYYDGKYRW